MPVITSLSPLSRLGISFCQVLGVDSSFTRDFSPSNSLALAHTSANHLPG